MTQGRVEVCQMLHGDCMSAILSAIASALVQECEA